jgi:hypothetical protein
VGINSGASTIFCTPTEVGASPISGVDGTALFHDTNFDGVRDPQHDELLAILESPEALTAKTRRRSALND